MESPPPPIKPPRGIKSPRETSGLLMSVIRTLSSSESNEEREKEKAKLEREYKRTDQQLNELVSHHNKDLTQVMQLFSKISNIVMESRERLRFIKDSLQGCKSLLSCRRDELKKLWLEGIEQKHVLELLEKIEHLKDVPCKLDNCLASKDFYLGTLLLVRALQLGDGTLKEVEALRELRNDLHTRKEKLYEKILEELISYLYYDSTNVPNSSEPIKVKTKHDSKTENNTNNQQMIESSLLNKEEMRSFDNRLKMLIECLSLLNKLPDAVGHIKMQMQSGIFDVANKVSKNVITNPSEGIHPLLDYFSVLVIHLKKIAECHIELHVCLSSLQPNKDDLNLFHPSDVWSAIQIAVQHLLVDYLDIQSTTSENNDRPSSYSESTIFLSSYFNKRKNRPQRPSLFKFENSTLASSYSMKESSTSNSYIQSYKGHKQDKLIVCTPDVSNIKIIYNHLLKFLQEIEQITASYSSAPCQLNTFITDYIQKVYLRREMARVCTKVESVTKTTDTWCRPVTNNRVSEIGLSVPILQSTYDVSISINEMESLLETLHGHSNQIMDIILNVVRLYYDTCYAAYRGIVQPEPEDKRLCSAAWLKDEDINRFLKSLPNWIDLQTRRAVSRSKKSLKRDDTTEEESPEDIRQRNIKEAEILASNLGESGVSLHEIISESLHLKSLAYMQESMEWFASRIHQAIKEIKKLLTASQSGTSDSTSLLAQLQKISVDFEELSNTCLLVLHLEVRVQCFHYLLPKGNNKRFSKNGQELDPQILELSNVLLVIVDALSCLQPHKIKYIFEGLGHLIAKILMSLTQYTEKIDEGTIQKMCRNIFTLQQTISNITFTREVALDHARSYFQLFFITPEDILNKVLEKGPEFSELEYMNVLQLINRSCNNQDQSAIQKHLQKLSDILGEVGVTV